MRTFLRSSIVILAVFTNFFLFSEVHAQALTQYPPAQDPSVTTSSEASLVDTLTQYDNFPTAADQETVQALHLFEKRPATTLSATNFFAYLVQHAVANGMPVGTLVLILLLPLLATAIAFVRDIIGLPSLDMIVVIALAITLLSTGITAGMILLAIILYASILARYILKKLRIMYLPKMALSMLIVSIIVFLGLTAISNVGLLVLREFSFLPILLLTILSERIIKLQLERTVRETILIAAVTLLLSLIGFVMFSSSLLQTSVLLYPELILLLIPINILMGRYFGLRLTEAFRFDPIFRHGHH